MKVLAFITGFYAGVTVIGLLVGWRIAVVRRRIAEIEVVLEAERIAREVAR